MTKADLLPRQPSFQHPPGPWAGTSSVPTQRGLSGNGPGNLHGRLTHSRAPWGGTGGVVLWPTAHHIFWQTPSLPIHRWSSYPQIPQDSPGECSTRKMLMSRPLTPEILIGRVWVRSRLATVCFKRSQGTLRCGRGGRSHRLPSRAPESVLLCKDR